MRLGGAVWLVACPLVAAIPSTSEFHTQNVLAKPQPASKSLWRKFSDSAVRKAFGIHGDAKPRRERNRQEPSVGARSRHGQDILVRFNFSTVEEATRLSDVARSMYLDIWDHTNESADIRLSKDSIDLVLKQLPKSMQHTHSALLQEKQLQQAILDTYPSGRKAMPLSKSNHDGVFTPYLSSPAPPARAAEHNIFFTDYQPLSVLAPWMRLLASLFTTHVRLVDIGLTHEKRSITALRVGVHPTNNDDPFPPRRKTVMVMGGLHAREWISVSTVSYIAYSLITGYGKDREITQLLEDFDWVFIPTINPDGYAYTWETDRLWRKNRQETPLRFCHGVDLDRSFPFQWDASTAGNPCSESYGGEAPLEGVEARALAEWMRNETSANNVDFVGLLDLHSYSQQILFPYSYSCDVAPPSLENLEELAAGLSKAIRINSGHSYIAHQACEGNVAVPFTPTKGRTDTRAGRNKAGVYFESAGGSALDWIYHDVGVRYAYQIKLRDRGAYGFLLPREHIVPSGREILEAALYFGRYLDGEFEGMKGKGTGGAGRGHELKGKGTGKGKGKLRSQAGW